MTFEPPFTLVERYEVEEEIGRGGHAIVYRAHDRTLSRDVAVKLLREDAISRDSLGRFRQEMIVTAQLEHPHILHVYDSGEFRGRPYIVMELASGRTLAERLAREGQLPVADALQIARDIGLALAHAHAHGVVHRDIKPDNILLNETGAILADFGIARVSQEMAVRDATSTGMAVGTVQYMSPEQLCAERNIDGRSDQYSMACVMYEMLAGVRPHIAATVEGLRLLRVSARHQPVSAHRPSVSSSLDRAIMTALSSMPADRFRNMGELLAALGVGPSGEFRVDDSSETSATIRASKSQGNEPVVTGNDSRSTSNARKFASAAIVSMLVVALGSLFIRRFSGPSTSAALDSFDEAAISVMALQTTAQRGVAESQNDGRLAKRLVRELERWDGLKVSGGMATTEATADAALAAARRRRIPFLITQDSEPSQVRTIRFRLVDVRTGAERTSISQPVANNAVWPDSVWRRISVELLSAIGPRGLVSVRASDTRSYTALRAFADAGRFINQWQLDSAEQLLGDAIALDPDYAAARVWNAQRAVWLAAVGQRPRALEELASQALDTMSNDRAQRLHARALHSLAQRDFPRACRLFDSLAVAPSTSFIGWLGAADCRWFDRVVIRSTSNSPALAFRGGAEAMVRALEQAMQKANAQTARAVIERMERVAPVRLAVRMGYPEADVARKVGAYMSVVADTFAQVPLDLRRVTGSTAGSVPATIDEALKRARRLHLTMAERWTVLAPRSPEAHRARAIALEHQGRIDSLSGLSAIREMSLAMRFANGNAPPQWRVDLFRMLLRSSEFTAAGRLADSVLSAPASAQPDPAALASLSAFLGRLDASAVYWAQSLQAGQLQESDSTRLPKAVLESQARYLVSAAVAGCSPDSLKAARASLRAAISAEVRPVQQDDVFAQLVWRPDMLAASCFHFVVQQGGAGTGDALQQIQRSFGMGEVGRARRRLASLSSERGAIPPTEVAVDYSLIEADLSLALGDTASAVKTLDRLQRTIASSPAFRAEEPAHIGALLGLYRRLATIGQGHLDEDTFRSSRKSLAELSAVALRFSPH